MFYYKILDRFDQISYDSRVATYDTIEEAWEAGIEHYRAYTQIYQDGYRFTVKVYDEKGNEVKG